MFSRPTTRSGAALTLAAVIVPLCVGVGYFKQHSRDVRTAQAYACGRVSMITDASGNRLEETPRCRQVRETWESLK